MRRTIVIGLLVALALSTLGAPAVAKKKKKKAPPPPAPIAHTLYFDGEESFGEVESNAATGTFLKLNPAEPDGSSAKSMQILNYVAGPNTNCAGNTLFPVFVGNLTGTVTGPMKVTLFAQSTPAASVELRIWSDVNALACNADYPEPTGVATVALPSPQGSVEGTTESLTFTSTAVLMLQVTPAATLVGPQRVIPPFVGRVQYDAGSAASKIEFMCLPPAGQTTCTPPA